VLSPEQICFFTGHSCFTHPEQLAGSDRYDLQHAAQTVHPDAPGTQTGASGDGGGVGGGDGGVGVGGVGVGGVGVGGGGVGAGGGGVGPLGVTVTYTALDAMPQVPGP